MKWSYLITLLLIFFSINIGYAEDEKMDEIVLAGGCFWGMEDLIGKLDGVVNTEVGYAGGKKEDAFYDFVKTGKTNHAEAIKVTYNNSVISLEEILKYFFKIHDPTTMNRQGNDVGTQYRSAIFFNNEKQKQIALSIIKNLEENKVWKNKITTTLEPLNSFFKAEEYHQDYLLKNPNGYTCHFERDFEF